VALASIAFPPPSNTIRLSRSHLLLGQENRPWRATTKPTIPSTIAFVSGSEGEMSIVHSAQANEGRRWPFVVEFGGRYGLSSGGGSSCRFRSTLLRSFSAMDLSQRSARQPRLSRAKLQRAHSGSVDSKNLTACRVLWNWITGCLQCSAQAAEVSLRKSHLYLFAEGLRRVG
jgi:hypothetical protein